MLLLIDVIFIFRFDLLVSQIMASVAQLHCPHITINRHLILPAFNTSTLHLPNFAANSQSFKPALNFTFLSPKSKPLLCCGGGSGVGGIGHGSGGRGGDAGGSGGDASNLDSFGLFGALLSGWRSRVAADPQFVFKVLMEEVVGVSSAVLGDMASRPNFGLNELDFVFSTLVVGSILNFTLMYLLAPTLGSTSTTLPFIFANCPKSHMFEPGLFSVINRLGTLVYKGTLFAAVGLAAGLVGTALSNGLIKMRKKMDPNFESPNKPPPMLLNAITWAIHMGVSSNLRYQTLNGIEFLLAKAVPPVVFKSSVIGLRMANNVLGGMTFVMLARVTGSQSSGPEKKVNKVVDEENPVQLNSRVVTNPVVNDNNANTNVNNDDGFQKVVNRKRDNTGSSAGNKLPKGVPVRKGFQVGKEFVYQPRASNAGSNGDNGTRGETYSKAGLYFTWNHKPKDSNGIIKKINRIMSNLQFNDDFFGSFSIFQPYRISDHSPCVLRWSVNFEGCAMFRVVKRLKGLKSPFPRLLHDHGNLHEQVNKLRMELDEAQKAIDMDPPSSILREEHAHYLLAFKEAQLDEERFLKQKAKIEWLKAGDSNTTYLHKILKSKCARNKIEMVSDASNIIYDGNQVSGAFVNHYSQFLGAERVTNPLDDHGLFTRVLDNAKADFMVHDVFNDEVKSVIFSMGDDRAPGPDDFTADFFKKTWDGLGNIVSINQSAIVPGRRIYGNLLLTQELMRNYIRRRGPPRCAFKVDIQKAYDTVDWSFLETILVGFGFHPKMVQWIMVKENQEKDKNRIKTGQKGKRGEAGKSLKQLQLKEEEKPKKTKKEWPKTHTRIKSYSTLKEKKKRKGPEMQFFQSSTTRTKTANCPITDGKPAINVLMVTCMVGLGRRVRNSDEFQYQHLCEQQRIINLCFADDLFLFAHGHPSSVAVIMDALKKFKQVFGLVPSIPKSTAFVCNVPNVIKASILNSMLFVKGALPVRYLGDMKKGKAKVAWDSVCMPKHKGGLAVMFVRDGASFSKLDPQSDLLFGIRLTMVWSKVRVLCGMDSIPPRLIGVTTFITPISKGKTAVNILSRLVVAATSYYIWMERNGRLFKKKTSSLDQIIEVILSMVRLKLVTFKFKKMSTGSRLLLDQWKIPSYCIVHDRSSR
nr:protein reticulata-related 3, chloroplastic-like [Tanacetum cinerariifolium]